MRFFNQPLIILMAGLAASSMMAGCAGMPWDKKAKPRTENVTIGERETGVQIPQGYPTGDEDLKNMTTTVSGGSVELYNLDNGQTYGGNGQTIPQSYTHSYGGGVPMANDPSVTVYPLDGASDNYMPVQPQGGSMGLYNPNASMGGGDNAPRGPQAQGGVSSVYFQYGSANLGGQDQSVLREVAETAKFAPVDRIVVEGHASTQTQTDDPIKSRILNLKESVKRATAVSETLIEQGVPAEKIKTVGWGDTKQGPGGEDQQRRVDIVTGGGY